MIPAPPCRCYVGAAALLLCLPLGCRSTASTPGDHLPVVPADSRALPGSVNSADAPEAPRVQTNGQELTTFRDPETGFSFQYPATWRPLVAGGVMHEPAFVQKLGPALGSQAFLSAGTSLASTDLLGVSFAWTAKPKMNAATCARMSADALPMGTELPSESIAGTKFQRGMTGDSGTCQQTRALLDTTWREGRCLFFERDIQTACPEGKTQDTRVQLTPTQQSELQAQLDAIMASVRLR